MRVLLSDDRTRLANRFEGIDTFGHQRYRRCVLGVRRMLAAQEGGHAKPAGCWCWPLRWRTVVVAVGARYGRRKERAIQLLAVVGKPVLRDES
jgi:hypothetical protein